MCKAEPHGILVAAICSEQKSLILRPISPSGDVEEATLAKQCGQRLFACDLSRAERRVKVTCLSVTVMASASMTTPYVPLLQPTDLLSEPKVISDPRDVLLSNTGD